MKEEIARITGLCGAADDSGFSYDDLCIHLDLDLPEDYKILNFKTFNGIGNPTVHMRSYCDRMVGVGKNKL